MTKPHITFLDSYTLNPGDLDWAPISKLGHWVNYEHTTPEEIIDRAQSCEVLLVNKTKITSEIISHLPWLKCICVTATGYNNVDLEAATKRGIAVCNVSGYSTPSVAQHAFALLLELTNSVGLHDKSVKKEKWSRNRDFSYQEKPVMELSGKTMGIYGMGTIGQEIAKIAAAFGMNIIYNNRSTKNFPDWEQVEIERLWKSSDVIVLAASLSKENFQIINKYSLAQMKPSALLINTSRGDLIDEEDLHQALAKEVVAGAAVDVLSQEPPREDHPLVSLRNCIVTPHIAWASRESRKRLLLETAENIKAYLRGTPINVVNTK
ncbi:MAG: D-2-hydroxyacid dehydrogenase [Saprospiraceae bacterium]